MKVAAAFALLSLAASVGAQDAGLKLRGGESLPAGAVVTAVDEQGVLVTDETGGAHPISWDRVERIATDRWPIASRFGSVGDRAWRARTRLERGDAVGAEELFEDLFAEYEAKRGSTSATVAMGVLHCRLSRGSLTPAVPALLALVASGGPPEGWLRASRADLDPADLSAELIYDDAMGLSPLLAPVWIRTPAVTAMAHGPWPMSSGSSDRAAQLSRLYETSARFEAGLPVSLGTRPASDEGLQLVYDVVASRVGDATQREAARAGLRDRLAKAPTAWVGVWCRAALGRSMLLESGPDARLLAVAELLRVPATAERVQPFLTGVCLAEAAVALAADGDQEDAARLRDELSVRFPQHPALQWDMVGSIGRSRAASNTRPAAATPAAQPDNQTTSDKSDSGGSP